jgi:putative ABC transport system permease protein
MFDLDNWQEIWQTITRNKTRSFLTGFGVFWGLFMLIILMGLGRGFKDGTMGHLDGLSFNSVIFWARPTSEPYKGFRKGRRWQMNMRDLASIREKAQSVDILSPVIFGPRSTDNTVRGLKTGTYTNIGVMPEYYSAEQTEVLHGRTINLVDIEERRKVCVIGEEVYETLFDIGENPLGEEIRLNGRFFQVVGVTRASGSLMANPRMTVYLPFSTMQQTFTRGDTYGDLLCTAKPKFSATIVEEEVKAIFRANHDIAPNDDKAFGSVNIERRFLQFSNLFLGIDVLVLIVGLGALFSGIIGISNIMLVTVRERTREIGVRRALGAKPWNILMQIMNESIVLTGIAGLLGFIVATGILIAISQVMSTVPPGSIPFGPPLISFNLALGAMGLLIVCGAIAGLMPALKALQIKAIDAIRDE